MKTLTTMVTRPYFRSNIDWTLITDSMILLILCCLATVIVNPIGDFPLGDDWSYGRTVRHLLETGEYRSMGWASMTLISNVLWGYLFCLPYGFSFTALRFSTLVASFIGLVGVYILVRELPQSRRIALLITLTLGFNPLYLTMSHTFVTDVGGITASTWATVFLSRALRNGSSLQMLIGAGLAVVATLSRQFALCIPLAFAIAVLLKTADARRRAWHAATPLVLCVGAYLAYTQWLTVTNRLPEGVLRGEYIALPRLLEDMTQLIRVMIGIVYFGLLYLGLFLLPVLLYVAKDIILSHERHKNSVVMASIVLLIVCAAGSAYFGDGILIPSSVPGSWINRSGVGLLILRDTAVLHLDHVPALPSAFWVVVTVMSFVGAVLLIIKLGLYLLDLAPRLIKRRSIDGREAVVIFMLLGGLLYTLPFLALGFVYDRYVVALIPFFAIILVEISRKPAPAAYNTAHRSYLTALSLVGIIGLFAIASTRDYLMWNRIRWVALRDLMQSTGLDAQDIDGGFEFNAFYLYDSNYDYSKDPSRSPWWVNRDTYQIGFGPVPNYSMVKTYSYSHWMPPHTQTLVVLRKIE